MTTQESWTDEVAEVAASIADMREMATLEGWDASAVTAAVAREMAHVQALYGSAAALELAALVTSRNVNASGL